MKTDLPLKRLTALRASDLLPLLGAAGDRVLDVLTLELPAGATRLDTVLRAQTAEGVDYLHLIEWQGYPDADVLWRTLGYLSWLGQHRSERPILATIVYLQPAAERSDTLRQELAGREGWMARVPSVRLWQIDAQAALAQETPGLAVLSPLMANMAAADVERAITIIQQYAPETQQNELLTVLGVFAEGLITPERFTNLITREQIMSSQLISYLFQDELREQVAEQVAIQVAEQVAIQVAEQVAALEQQLSQTLLSLLLARFPDAPLGLVQQLQQISDLAALQRLIVAVALAPDAATAERLLLAEAQASSGAP